MGKKKVTSSEIGDLKNENEMLNNAEIKESNDQQETKQEGSELMSLKAILADLQNQISELKKAKDVDTSEEIKAADDYLDVPAVFFSFSFEYSCHADVRNGKESLPPLGQFVKFKKLYRYNRKGAAGRGVETISVSQATIRSKSTAEWLRKHTLFGIKFFENINDVKSVDVTLAEKMAESSARVSSMSDLQVIERSRAEGIPTNADLDQLRKELIQKLALDDIKRKQNSRKKVIEVDENGRALTPSILSDDKVSSKKDVY